MAQIPDAGEISRRLRLRPPPSHHLSAALADWSLRLEKDERRYTARLEVLEGLTAQILRFIGQDGEEDNTVSNDSCCAADAGTYDKARRVLGEYADNLRKFKPNARLYLLNMVIAGAAMGIFRLLFNFYVLSSATTRPCLDNLVTINSLTALGCLAERFGGQNWPQGASGFGVYPAFRYSP
jgi:hypothetical protein